MPTSRLRFCRYTVLLYWSSSTHNVTFTHRLSHSTFISVQEEQNRGKPNWEHLNEDLHVLITVEDTQARAEIKMKRAVEEVKKLLVPAVSTYYTQLHTQIVHAMSAPYDLSVYFSVLFKRTVIWISKELDTEDMVYLYFCSAGRRFSILNWLSPNNRVMELHMATHRYPTVSILFTSIYRPGEQVDCTPGGVEKRS